MKLIEKNVAKLIEEFYLDLEIDGVATMKFDEDNKIVVYYSNSGYLLAPLPLQNRLSKEGYKAYDQHGSPLFLFEFGELKFDEELKEMGEEFLIRIIMPSSVVKYIYVDRNWLEKGDKCKYKEMEFEITAGPFTVKNNFYQYKINHYIITRVGEIITKL